MFSVTVENSFDFRSQEYATLFAASQASAFQNPSWMAALYEKLLEPNGATPLIVVVREHSDDRLVMVLPLVRRRYAGLRVVEFADLRVCDYVAPVVTQDDFEGIAADRAAVRRIGRLAKPYEVIRIAKLDSSVPAVERLFGVEGRVPMGVSAYRVPLLANYEDWRQERLGKSFCKELDKKARQLAKRGTVSFSQLSDPTEIAVAFEAMRGYRHRRYADDADGDLTRVDAYFDFYAGIASEPGTAFARTYALRVDGHPVACALGLVHRGSLLVILNGFDEEGFGRHSVGNLMFQGIADDCIARGGSDIDFTIGDEPYKVKFGGEARPMSYFSRAGNPVGLGATLAVEKVPSIRTFARRVARRGKRAAGAADA